LRGIAQPADLVQPLAARGQFIDIGWKAQRDEAARKGTLEDVC